MKYRYQTLIIDLILVITPKQCVFGGEEKTIMKVADKVSCRIQFQTYVTEITLSFRHNDASLNSS